MCGAMAYVNSLMEQFKTLQNEMKEMKELYEDRIKSLEERTKVLEEQVKELEDDEEILLVPLCKDCEIETKKHCDVCGGYGSE